ncbi:YidC/Oxa1 family membrane protein insertase [Candidatus Saccharibacteria bacterium]|nr:YidC/Oxa1 family membrane protein insertase [Candidatus Saccharibacteria bacterium]
MIANIFTTIIVQPIFNLLVLIYGLLPGHNFGLAIVIFTILVRLAMWPLVKKQLNHAKAMRELAPELKKIKAAAKGDRQKESAMTMELYKEREINPFASLGIVLVQLPILLGLYAGLNRIIHNPHEIVSFSYPAVQHLGWIQTLSHNIHKFDNTLLGIVDLTKTAIGNNGVYWVGLAIAAASSVAQYFQSKQLMPQTKDARSLRHILREAGKGKTADQTEVNAAVGRSTLFLIPGMVFIFAVRLSLALPLYWLTSSLVAYIQQARVLREDAQEADASVQTPESASVQTMPSGLKVTRKTLSESKSGAKSSPAKNKKAARNKRRRR